MIGDRLPWTRKPNPAIARLRQGGVIFAHNEPSPRLFDGFDFRRWGYLPRVVDFDGAERDLVIVGLRVEETQAV